MIPYMVTEGNRIYGHGMVESGMSLSLEQYVIDDEISKAVIASERGVPVTDELIDLETILKVGPAKNYLSEKTTLKNLDRFWLPEMLDRDWRTEWERKGWKNIYKIACEKVDDILANYEPEPLDRDINKELEKIVKENEKKAMRRRHA